MKENKKLNKKKRNIDPILDCIYFASLRNITRCLIQSESGKDILLLSENKSFVCVAG